MTGDVLRVGTSEDCTDATNMVPTPTGDHVLEVSTQMYREKRLRFRDVKVSSC